MHHNEKIMHNSNNYILASINTYDKKYLNKQKKIKQKKNVFFFFSLKKTWLKPNVFFILP